MSRLPLAGAFLSLTVLGLGAAAAATAEDPDVAAIQRYVYSSSASEASVRQLLDANPRLANARDENGPILAWALDSIGLAGEVGRRARTVAELLVATGADVNAVATDGNAIIFKYAMFARVPQLEFLTSHGAKVGVKDKEDGRSPLHWVALLEEHESDGTVTPKEQVDGYLAAAGVLLAAGSRIDATDTRGTTPLAATCFLGNARMAELLIARGADVNAVDGAGYSVLGNVLSRGEETWANDKEKATLPAVVALLRKHGARDVRPKE